MRSADRYLGDGSLLKMTDDDTSSIMLFTDVDEQKSTADPDRYGLLQAMGGTVTKGTRAQCIDALADVLYSIPFEQSIPTTIRVCGACSRSLLGSPFCAHCRCGVCLAWKAACACKQRQDNRRKIESWMKNGFVQWNKTLERMPTTHCLMCEQPLSMLSAPYLRCMTCLARSLHLS